MPEENEPMNGMSTETQAQTSVATSLHVTSFVATSPEMQDVMRQVKRVAQYPRAAVLVLGESGVGKEAVTNEIHKATAAALPHRTGPIVKINLSGLPDSLIENELFGHVKGSFTGAMFNKEGLLSIAHKGTVFLDEIANMGINIQGKILNFLDDYEVRPIGSVRSFVVDTRIVAATNANLKKAVADKTFREDLYYRLAEYPINIPPLRTRAADIPDLVSAIIRKFNVDNGKTVSLVLSSEAISFLTKYPWPGNVRQLQHVLRRAMILGDGVSVTLSDLQYAVSMEGVEPSEPSAQEPESTVIPEVWPGSRAPVSLRKAVLTRLFTKHGYNKAKVCEELGVCKKTLYNWIAKAGMNDLVERRNRPSKPDPTSEPVISEFPTDSEPPSNPEPKISDYDLHLLEKLVRELPEFEQKVFLANYGIGQAEISQDRICDDYGLTAKKLKNLVSSVWAKILPRLKIRIELA